MQPWVREGEDRTPDGQVLGLWRRGTEWAIRVDGQLLMSSRQHGSEEAMVEAAREARRGAGARWLVGGLGMGYTLRAALGAVGDGAQVVVAELSQAVVTWNRGPLAHLSGEPLRDPRTVVHAGDVRVCMARRPAAFDAILLDVDNGPGALSTTGNAALYGERGLTTARNALRPGGVLVVWSAAPDPAFAARLERSGFRVTVESAAARGASGGAQHVLFVGRIPGA